MKTLKLFLMMTGVAVATLIFQSCLDDDGYSLGDFEIAIATVESEDSSSSHFFRRDDGATLWPASGYYLGHNLEARQRVILNYTILSDSLKDYSHYVRVNDIDLILTKHIAEDKLEENDSIYGTDPVEIKEIWISNNFLNILFTANYGGQVKHFVNLVKIDRVETADGPYYLEFRHNAYDDPAVTRVTGPVCFDLLNLAPNAGEKVKLTVGVITTDGSKAYTFEYDPKQQQNGGLKDASRLGAGYASNVE